MTKPLFDIFDPVSSKQWKQKIQFDLKGADYNEALIHKSLEGIDIKPFYHSEDLEDTNHSIANPDSWKICQHIEINNISEGKLAIKKALETGVESLFLKINSEEIEIEELLETVIQQTSVYITTSFLSKAYSAKIATLQSKKTLQIYLLTDIIGNLAATGNWYKNLKEDHLKMLEITNKTINLKSTISVDLSLYQNAGATMTQQLAYGLAHANEYLNHFSQTDYNPLSKQPITFKVAVGSNYFFEIAKLKALRLLWTTLAQEYKVFEDCYIIVSPSHRNKSILDYNVNMLRTTTECMSGILGGADSVYNLPYDDIYNFENDFGTRISNNQLLILKEESHFDLVQNPTEGTYYIENLTDQMAKNALDIFKTIEQGGGFLSQLKRGAIQKKIKESSKKEKMLFNEENISLIGVNKFINSESEEIKHIVKKQPFKQKRPIKTLIEPIITNRLAEETEIKFLKKC